MKELPRLKIKVIISICALFSVFPRLTYAEDLYGPFPAAFKLSILNGTNGFAINGIANMGYGRILVSGAGDVNGDGIDDILIGAGDMNNGIGQSYVVFGSKRAWPAAINLIDLDGITGAVIDGINAADESGTSISGAGDVNGDGIDDILIGAPGANNGTGQSYVIFGRKGAWPATISLYGLDGTDGFVINGINPGDKSGASVSGAGDINADGISDILIGAPFANNQIGQTYLIFGSQQPWPAVFNATDLDSITGFILDGISDNGQGEGGLSGGTVARAGDVNGDAIDDVLINSPLVWDGRFYVGQSYVVFGNKSGWWPALFALSKLDGNNGFAINGSSIGFIENGYGNSINGAGDINGDGVNDILISSSQMNNRTGKSYVVFGSKQRWPRAINLGNLNGNNGFVLSGIRANDFSGQSISGTGDVNRDGIDDILIGAPGVNNGIGQSYVVFGTKSRRPQELNLVYLNGTNGFTMNGVSDSYTGYSVSGAGDVNGDGIEDLLICAPHANGYIGQSYIVFGR